MISHELKIGQRIYDIHDDRYGEVLLIGGENRGMNLTDDESDMIILYRPDDSTGECETTADDVYPVIEGVTHKGHPVCLEILEEFPNYFCPDTHESFLKIESCDDMMENK